MSEFMNIAKGTDKDPHAWNLMNGINNIDTTQYHNIRVIDDGVATVTNLTQVFNNSSKTNLRNVWYYDFSYFNLANVTNMSQVFNGSGDMMNNVRDLNFTGTNMAGATNITNMFFNMRTLRNLTLKDVNLYSATGEYWCNIGYMLPNLGNITFSNVRMDNITRFCSLISAGNAVRNINVDNVYLPKLNNANYLVYAYQSTTIYNANISDIDIPIANRFDQLIYTYSPLTRINLNISNINAPNLDYIYQLFNSAGSYINVRVDNVYAPKLNLTYNAIEYSSNINTFKVTNSNIGMLSNKTLFVKNELNLYNLSSEYTNVFPFAFNLNQINSMEINTQEMNLPNLHTVNGLFSGSNLATSVNLTELTNDKFAFLKANTVTSFPSMFQSCGNIATIEGLDEVMSNKSLSNSLSYMFYYCNNLRYLDVSNWNTSNVTNMAQMFEDCYYLYDISQNIKGIENWDTSNVTNMVAMFRMFYMNSYGGNYFKNQLNDINLANWNMENVTSMGAMFDYYGYNGSNATITLGHRNSAYSLYSGSSPTGGLYEIGVFDMSNIPVVITNGYGLFQSISPRTLKMNNVRMSGSLMLNYMFANSHIGNFYVNNLTVDNMYTSYSDNMWYAYSTGAWIQNLYLDHLTFKNNIGITTWGGCLFKANQSIHLTNFVVENARNMYNIFVGNSSDQTTMYIDDNSINTIENIDTSRVNYIGNYMMYFKFNRPIDLNLTNWDMSNITSMSSIFRCSNINSINISGWRFPKLPDTQCGVYIAHGVNHVDASNVKFPNFNINATYKSYNSMFSGTKYLDLSNSDITYGFNNSFDLINVNLDNSTLLYFNFVNMFYNCRNLRELNLSAWENQLTNLNNLYNTFSGCENLSNIEGIENWNVSTVTNMCGMFTRCNNITNLNVSNWNTSNVTDMGSMFAYCNNLKNIEGIENLDTSNVAIMNGMFEGCNNISDFGFVQNWNTSNVKSIYRMFGSLNNSDTDLYLSGITAALNSSFGIQKVNAIHINDMTFHSITFPSDYFSSTGNTPYINFSNMQCERLNVNTYGLSYNNKTFDFSNSRINTIYTLNNAFSIGYYDGVFSVNLSNAQINYFTFNNMYSCMNVYSITLNASNFVTYSNEFPFGLDKKNYFYRGMYFANFSNATFHNATLNYKIPNYTNFSNATFTNVTSFANLATSMEGLNTFNFSHVNAGKVITTAYMFNNARNAKNIDFSNVYMPNITEAQYMFYYCFNLVNLNLDNFNFYNVTNAYQMFGSCGNLSSDSLNYIANALPYANQLTNQYLSNMGLNWQLFDSIQQHILNSKGYIDVIAPPIETMTYNITYTQ